MIAKLLPYLSVFFGSLVATLILTPIVRELNRKFGMVDKPDPRRINTVPIPRGGGLAIVLGLVTNHGGTALLRCHDTSGTANMGTEYYATIFVRTRTGGTLAGTIAMIRGSDSALYVNNLNDSDKIYFSINPDGRRVKIGSGAGTLEGS